MRLRARAKRCAEQHRDATSLTSLHRILPAGHTATTAAAAWRAERLQPLPASVSFRPPERRSLVPTTSNLGEAFDIMSGGVGEDMPLLVDSDYSDEEELSLIHI